MAQDVRRDTATLADGPGRAIVFRWGLATLGGVMTVLALGQLIVQLPPVVPTVIQHSALVPFAVALTLFGIYLARTIEDPGLIWRVTRWSLVGGGIMVVLASWAVVSNVLVGEQYPDIVRTVLGGSTLGLLSGSLIGYYHEQSKQRARELAAVEQRQLSQLVSLLSHDLQSPVSVAKHNLDRARAQHAVDSEHLDSVEQSLTQIQTLVEKTLDLIDSEDGATETRPINLDALARETWDLVETTDAELHSETELCVHADRHRMVSLLQNLFENAVTHAGPDVSVRIGRLPDGFYIEDDGPGIATDDRQRVREIGYRGTGGGSGLGLAIVDQIVSEHDWTLSITESETGGARFEITDVTIDDRAQSSV